MWLLLQMSTFHVVTTGKMGVVRFVVPFLVVANICIAEKGKGGNWIEKQASNPFYLALAQIAASQSSKDNNLPHYYTVKELLKVQMKTAPGVTYKLKMKVAESNCTTDTAYNKKTCTPKSGAEDKTCTAVIYIPPGKKNALLSKEVTSFNCKGSRKQRTKARRPSQ
ncbi:salivary cystatin-L2-like [Ornithodoros turicata]|uniref:salivary cystatin-L2-like n=1 Tax=Ornithodoros turicata TaxID=34597 RepID=UPI003138A6FA